MKFRARGIIIKNAKVLLMKRFKYGENFYVLPGGGVKKGETLEAGLVREFKEETSLDIFAYKKIGLLSQKVENDAYIFLITNYSGIVKLGGEELEANCEENSYELIWVDISTLNNIIFYPEGCLELINDCV